ncbi:hypothetical protein OS493_040662, partial [Desmophyllum pertusum]
MKAFYKQEADNRLSGLDTNKDGKVSWEEYAKGAEKQRSFHRETKKRERRRFEHANVNKDSLLSSDELIPCFILKKVQNMFGVIVE